MYRIESLCSPNRYYIGSTVNYTKRRYEHLFLLRRNKHHSPKLQRHYNKYGEADLVFIIIDQFNFNLKEQLLLKEQFYIDKISPWFNVCQIAGSILGIKRSEETKEKHRKASTGKSVSLETRQKLRDFNLGKPSPNKGKKASPETIQRLKDSHRDQRPTEEMNIKRAAACKRPVLQFDKNMVFIKEWLSTVDIIKEHPEWRRNTISTCITDKNHTAYGFIWKRKDKINLVN